MFNWIKNLRNKVRSLNSEINEYRKDTIIQSLPSLAYVNKAKKLIEENKLKEAEEILIKASELPQNDALVYKYLGIIYDKTFRFFDAVNMYQKSADINPEDKNIWQKLGFALINIREYDRAEKSFDNSNKISPCNSDTFTGWGMSFMKAKKYSEAREKFIEAAKFNRYNFTAIFLSAVMEINLKMYDDAEVKLKFLSSVAPNEANFYELAHLKYLKNDFDNAIYYAKKVLELNSKMLPAYLLLGDVYSQRYDEGSLNFFLQAEEKGLVNEVLYYEWGKALLRFSRYQESKHYLLKAINMTPDNVDVVEMLALCNVLQNDMQDAPPLIEKLRSMKPDSLILEQIDGILKYMYGDFYGAISLLKVNVGKLLDNNFLNWYYMAKSAQMLNNKDKTKEYFENAILKNPTYLKAYIEYAKFFVEQEDYQQAQRKLRKAIKIQSENIEVLNLLFHVSYILVKQNLYEYNVKEAVSIAKQIPPDLFEYQAELDDLNSIQIQRN